MPEGTNQEAMNIKESDDIIKDNEKPVESLKNIAEQKSGEISQQGESQKSVISVGDSSVAGKTDSYRKFSRRDNKPSKFGQSVNGGFDAKESQRHNRFRRKICRFCLDKNAKVNYRESQILANYITERGKILPRRITGTCAKHQREVSKAIKRARILAILPFSVK